jgi:hypothetical protein
MPYVLFSGRTPICISPVQDHSEGLMNIEISDQQYSELLNSPSLLRRATLIGDKPPYVFHVREKAVKRVCIIGSTLREVEIPERNTLVLYESEQLTVSTQSVPWYIVLDTNPSFVIQSANAGEMDTCTFRSLISIPGATIRSTIDFTTFFIDRQV